MNCCCWFLLTAERKQQNLMNRQIEELIKNDKRHERTRIKLLLLGTGESGKSTFIRQMRIIYTDGFPDEEKQRYVKVILENILSSMKAMVEAMSTLHINFARKENANNARLIRAAEFESFAALTDMYVLALKELWDDDGIQKCFIRRREYQLIDSIKYYMQCIERIAEADYVPTDEDILHMRVPTTGLVEYQFKLKKVEFRMIDVGGQRSERKKWIHCFDNVKVIIFLVAISEYDQILKEAGEPNRLVESLNVFRSIANYDWFNSTSIVVFFNKTDLLAEKIVHSDLKNYFPDFEGPPCNYQAACTYIETMFKDAMPNRKIYRHYTCATDTENIKVVFAVVRETILEEHLRWFGISDMF